MYYHSNKKSRTYKGTEQLVYEVVKAGANVLDKNVGLRDYAKKRGLEISTDHAATGIIVLLNQEAQAQKVDKYIEFVACSKHPVKERIDILRYVLSQGRVGADKKASPNLFEELELYQGDELKADKGIYEPLKLFDHILDAFFYAIDQGMYDMVENFDIIRDKKLYRSSANA